MANMEAKNYCIQSNPGYNRYLTDAKTRETGISTKAELNNRLKAYCPLVLQEFRFIISPLPRYNLVQFNFRSCLLVLP